MPVVLAVAVTCVPAASAGTGVPAGGPVGGPLLTRHGVVYDRAVGVGAPPKVSASSYVVADVGTGQVLAAKDAHVHYRPASTLKVLTAVTLLPRLDPNTRVRPTRTAVNAEGSKVGVVTSMRYRVQDLFRGMLMASGNDAALTITRAVGGEDRALELMNAEAQELQAYDTVAKTPNGLDAPGQYSSAYDLALFTRAGLRMPAFRKYVSTLTAQFPGPGGKSYQIANHNKLLTRYDGAIGVKTGYTTKALGTYVGAARRDGHTIVITMMHTRPDYWDEAEQLLDWGFAADGTVEPVGTLVGPRPPATPSASPRAVPTGVQAPPASGPAPGSNVLYYMLAAGLALTAVSMGGFGSMGRLARGHPGRRRRRDTRRRYRGRRRTRGS